MLSLFGGQSKIDARNAGASQKSLALPNLLPESEGAVRHVLDLGPARPANLDFFSHYGGQVTVADLYGGLMSMDAVATTDEGRPAEVFAKLLDYDATTRFDLILAWDVLNYLRPSELNHLMNALERFCVPGTTMLAFVSSLKEMPPGPSSYSIRDPQTLHFEVREGRSRPSPRYREGDLLKRMPCLSVENRYQLRNGMLEYVFSYRATSRPAGSAEMPQRASRDSRLAPTR